MRSGTYHHRMLFGEGSEFQLRATIPSCAYGSQLSRGRHREDLRVAGVVGEHARIDADLAQRARVFFIDVVAEHQVRIGIAMQPTITLDFRLQLSGPPAGIAEREDRMPGT